MSNPVAGTRSVRTIKNPDFPNGQRGGAPVPVTAPTGGAAAESPLEALRSLPGRFLSPLPTPARVRVPVRRRGYRVTARRPGGQSHR